MDKELREKIRKAIGSWHFVGQGGNKTTFEVIHADELQALLARLEAIEQAAKWALDNWDINPALRYEARDRLRKALE